MSRRLLSAGGRGAWADDDEDTRRRDQHARTHGSEQERNIADRHARILGMQRTHMPPSALVPK
jgi:hypothetical protein